MTDLVEKELSYKISGKCFKVHNALGRFLTEKQYCDALESEFLKEKINFLREPDLISENSITSLKIGRPDFVVEDRIILDLKAKKFITKDDYDQMMKYLSLTRKKLGLIVNFHSTYIKPKRVINYTLHSQHSHVS